MNEKVNKNAKVEKFTNMLGIAVRLIVIDPLHTVCKSAHVNGALKGLVHDLGQCVFTNVILRQKGGDMTQSYDKSPYTHGNVKRAVTTHTTPQKSSIKQRLRTDLGRSVGVTTATQLVWLTWFTGPTFPLPATAV